MGRPRAGAPPSKFSPSPREAPRKEHIWILAQKLLFRAGMLQPYRAARLAADGCDIARLGGADYADCEAAKAARRRGGLAGQALENAEELERLPGWTWAAWTRPQFDAFVAQLTPRRA